VKYIILLCLALASAMTNAGTLTIIPDSTSSMGIQQQKREAAEKARAERQARIAAGIEQPPPVIIIRQAPQYTPPARQPFECRDKGFGRLSCY
jgi:hypothetical protein